jgi:serine/threonine-protein kinase CTR1
MSTTADEEPPRLSSMLRAPSVDDAGHLLDQVAAADVVYDDPPLVLGQGGFGIVMRSAIDGYNHRGDQITVAIKRVRPSRSGRPDVNESEQMEIMESMVEELHAEASMLAKLRHANIVSVLAINLSPEEGPFLVMQFCNHGTLKEALHPKRRISSAERRASKGTTPKTRKGRCMLTLQARLVLAEQIASAVAYLHARDPLIIHRDLKPANVLLMRVESPNDADGGVVRGVGPSNRRGLHRRRASLGAAVEGQDFQVVAMLTDFGLSRSRERHGAAVNTVLGGSYPYLAPEAFRHNAITEAVDIYSFGIMLLEIATLDAPWSGMAPYQITMEVAVEKKRPRVPITAKIPQGVFSLVRDCWSHEQSDRPAAMEVEMRMANILQTLPQEESDLPSADFSSSLKE